MLKLLSSTAVALALVGPVWAQSGADEAASGSMDPNRLVGQVVLGTEGERIGEVRDVVHGIRGQTGQIVGIIVEPDEPLGNYRGNIALDWEDIAVRPADQAIIADLSPRLLEGTVYREGLGAAGVSGTEELPDVSESQPGVITGEDIQERETAPGAGAGTTDGGVGADSTQ